MQYLKALDAHWRESTLIIFDDHAEKESYIGELAECSDAYNDAMFDGPLIDAVLFREYLAINYILEKMRRLPMLQWDFTDWMDNCYGIGRYKDEVPGLNFFTKWFAAQHFRQLLADTLDEGAAC